MDQNAKIVSGLRVDRLKEERARHGWSQRVFAEICGIGQAQITRYESNTSDPSATYLKIMASKLGVSADYLLGLTDDPQAKPINTELNDEERYLVSVFRREGWRGMGRLIIDHIPAQASRE